MNLRDHVSVNAVYLRLMVRLLQVGLFGIVCIGFIQFNWGIVINAGVALGVAITGAVFLHAVGALGPTSGSAGTIR